jgi:hypothetical protein
VDTPFLRLLRRAQPLGNYARKYTRAIETGGEVLWTRLEATGRLSRVALDRSAPSLPEAFDEVATAATGGPEQLALLGTYYAVQSLHMNARLLEQLAVDVAEQDDRLDACRLFLQRAETEFPRLASAYMRRVLRVLLPPRLKEPFVICSVGSRGHQDDIDVAVIDEGGPARDVLNRVLAQLGVQMLRHASTLDHYLAERVKAHGACVSLEELTRALCTDRLDFVVVTELLRAEVLAGRATLHRRLRDDVIGLFLYRPDGDNTWHEFYLRGLLGEIRSHMLRPPPPGSVSPKADALRLSVGLVLALKTTCAVPGTRTADLLRRLRARRPGLRVHLARLERSITFLDTFHHLANLLIAQEDQVAVEGVAARENLHRVALAMGYRDHGPLQAVDHLMVHYHESVGTAREVAVPLMDDVARHLAERSRLSRWTRPRAAWELAPRFTDAVIAATSGFRGARFWDDLLEALDGGEGRLLAALARGYLARPSAQRQVAADNLAAWGRDAPYAFLSIVVLLARRHASTGREQEVARQLTATFLRQLGEREEDVRALSRVFRFYPDLVNRFLLTLTREELARLRATLEVPIGSSELAEARDRFYAFIGVHRDTSRMVRRVLERLTERNDATVMAIPDGEALRMLARGKLAASERLPSPEAQRALLGQYYDLEFLRLALGTLQGTPSSVVRPEFLEVATTYVSALWDACLREAERKAGARIVQRDLVGIYVAGGLARMRPFVEDFDLIVVMDSRDEEDRAIADRAVALMNRHIARRGVATQYRVGERLGHFVTFLDEMGELLRQDDDDLFVDRHQLISARMLVGSPRVQEALLQQVVWPHVLHPSAGFVARLAREIREHRRDVEPEQPGALDIKEMPGGMRELDLCLGLACARLGLHADDGPSPFTLLAARDPGQAEAYRALRDAEEVFVAVRTVYRVAVAATNVLEREFLSAPARILGRAGGAAGATALFEEVQRHAHVAAGVVDQLAGLSSGCG